MSHCRCQTLAWFFSDVSIRAFYASNFHCVFDDVACVSFTATTSKRHNTQHNAAPNAMLRRHPLPCRLPPVEHYYCHLQSKSVPAPSRRHHEWCPVKQRSRRSSRVILLRPGPTTLLQHVDFIDMRLVPKGVQTTTLYPMLPSRVLLS